MLSSGVKKWKAFAAQVEETTKSLKKKDSKGATAAYQKALVTLNEYLELVELPNWEEIIKG